LEQAQVLDNKAELFDLFEKLNGQLGDYDSICIRVINEKDIVIAKQDVQINKLNDLSNNKDKQIENLQSQIADYRRSDLLNTELISNKDREIVEHKGEIKRLKRKMVIGGGVGGLIITGLIILLIK
jgi:peptidoglycan hydrolase CwlO-like protein